MTRRIMQFGTSRFLQAHVDLFVHEARSEGQDVGPIVVVKTTPGNEREQRLAAFGRPEGFPVIVRGLVDGAPVEKTITVQSVTRGLSAQRDWDEVVRLFADIDLVVSNVGDSGYSVEQSAASANANPPVGFPRILLALLRSRQLGTGRPLLVLPCELIVGNGDRLRVLLRDLAANSGLPQHFLDWFDTSVSFANTLVDRIVSEELNPIGAVAEPYALWAIETQPGIDIGFTHPAIQLHSDLMPVERLKLHLLNLSHTVLADRWLSESRPAGETVREILADARIMGILNAIVTEEVLPGFARKGMGPEAEAYWRTTFDRLRNPFLAHKLADIAGNHPLKVTRRLAAFLDWIGDTGVATPRLGSIVDRYRA